MTTLRDYIRDFASEVERIDHKDIEEEFIMRKGRAPLDDDSDALYKIKGEMIEAKLDETMEIINERIVG